MALDFGLSMVTTKWVYTGEDDWKYIKKGFIEASLYYMLKHPAVHDFLLRIIHFNQFYPGTRLVNRYRYWSWSLNPALRRMSHYKLLPGGFVGVTKNASYGKGAMHH